MRQRFAWWKKRERNEIWTNATGNTMFSSPSKQNSICVSVFIRLKDSSQGPCGILPNGMILIFNIVILKKNILVLDTVSKSHWHKLVLHTFCMKAEDNEDQHWTSLIHLMDIGRFLWIVPFLKLDNTWTSHPPASFPSVVQTLKK